jgi:hypothetical protein
VGLMWLCGEGGLDKDSMYVKFGVGVERSLLERCCAEL